MNAPALDAGTLSAVGELWKRQRRTVEANFAGDSMRPSIAPGEEVRIECGADCKPGDIVLFTYRGRVVLHRVRAILEDSAVLTRGDANAVGDFPVTAADIIGVLTAIRRDGAWVAPPVHEDAGTLVERWNRALLRRSRFLGELWLALRWRLRGLATRLRRSSLR